LASTDDFHTDSDCSSHPTSASKHGDNVHDHSSLFGMMTMEDEGNRLWIPMLLNSMVLDKLKMKKKIR
jgi:endo-1,4-beta-mannosidase